MREIKFRAWDLDEKKMVNLGSILHAWSCEPLTKRELEAFNFMQYTGLKDKNGVEIYEGDILSTTVGKNEFHAPMTWNKQRQGWDQFLPLERHEVIGNIYANPELLKDVR